MRFVLMKKLLIKMIRLYQKYISPMKRTKCPYIPTCSQYGLEAIEKYGALKGGLLAVWRILRCNPFSHGGYCDAILFPTEAMTLCHELFCDCSAFSRAEQLSEFVTVQYLRS